MPEREYRIVDEYGNEDERLGDFTESEAIEAIERLQKYTKRKLTLQSREVGEWE